MSKKAFTITVAGLPSAKSPDVQHVTRRIMPSDAHTAATEIDALCPSAAPPQESPDTELIGLGHRLVEVWEAEKADFANGSYLRGEVLEDAFYVGMPIVNRIESLPARTIEGLRVKALAASWMHCGDPVGAHWFGDGSADDMDGKFAASIIRDLLAINI